MKILPEFGNYPISQFNLDSTYSDIADYDPIKKSYICVLNISESLKTQINLWNTKYQECFVDTKEEFG